MRTPPIRLWAAAAAATTVIVVASMLELALSDPQIYFLNKGCSQYNATNLAGFFSNLNGTFLDLRSQLLSDQSKHFATAQRATTTDPVHAMVQCRDYLSAADCVACFDAAVSLIRNCAAANGARVAYDGCFLRYESNNFYDQTTLPGNVGICGNETSTEAKVFKRSVQGLLEGLEIATPRINGFFAAVKREVVGGSTNVYAMAQCAEAVSKSGCQDCLKVALGNIQSCPPDTDGRAVDAGCFLRYSTTAFFSDNKTTNISPFLGEGGSSKKEAIIVLGGGGGLLLLIIAIILWYRMSRKAKAAPRGDTLGATGLQGPVTFSYEDLKSATNNFSEEKKLGEGGFGGVYKGILRNGNVIAVKRLAISSRTKAEFETEVKLISNIHHRNIIRLLGCSNKGPDLLLVYDYMANGSLDRFLYGERRGTLNWKQRFDIIFGIARGLAYLHEQYHVCIIHRDIKPSNILLDADFLPKIADFGLIRLLPEDQSHLSTKFAGTLGYTAPEYALHGQLSEKVDTYSFGVVVLEIVSGRRCNEVEVEQLEPVSEHLLEKAWKLYEDDRHLTLVDENLDPNEYRQEEVKKVIEIALICTQSQVSLRPTMSDVFVLLVSDPSRELRRPTKASSIHNEKRIRIEDLLTLTGSSTSNATTSFTEFTSR